MRKNETIREEEIIVVFAKLQLEENLSLNAESLRKQLLKNYEKLKLTTSVYDYLFNFPQKVLR